MIRHLFLAGFMFCVLLGKSQAPVAQFSANALEGCSPLTVTFKDQSTGNPKFWNWDFGNGQLSNLQNPAVAYYNPGKYTVKLVVRNADGTDGLTKTDYITVYPSPYADFAADFTIACMPARINFMDKSATAAGTINKWEWIFGDGTTSGAQNPQKTFSTNGYYDVSLKVTSTTGCSYYNIRYKYIRVLSGITTAFNYAVDSVCRAPFKTTFTNLTSGPGAITYAWNFGNGDVSALTSPTDSFKAPGSYQVTLLAKSEFGCTDSIRKTITLNNLTTAFTSSDSACINGQVVFRNTSLPTPLSSVWDFGDASQSQAASPVKSYATAGTYQVKLVNKFAACKDSITRPVKVLSPPAVNFTAGNTTACKAPLTVSFQDVSPDAVSWQWNFGDGGTSTSKNQMHTYTAAGEYDVTLTITSAFGCKNTYTQTKLVKIVKPALSIANAPAGGCIPYVFTPVAGINAVDGVASYAWDYGEGGGWTSAANHTYATQGNYTVRLKATTLGGCTDSITIPNAVSTGTVPNVDFSSDTLQSCNYAAVKFQDNTVPSGSVLWDFGDDTTSTVRNPTHAYGNPGRYTVSLTSTNNGCAKTLTRPLYITVLPPKPAFVFQLDCKNKLTVAFRDISVIDTLKPVSYFWEFGQPALGTSTSKNPNFTFPSQGIYNIRLTVTNGPCTNTLLYPISFFKEKADFTISPSDTLCRSQPFTFTAVNSNPVNINSYLWSVKGSAFMQAPATFSAAIDTNGNYPVSLIINDKYGCSDTTTKNVTVIGPVPNFTAGTTAGCENTVVTFNDLSTPTGSITNWTFDFGDGTTQTFTKPPFVHQYKKAGLYSVTLAVTGTKGCTLAVTQKDLVRIAKPVVAFKAQTTLYCPGSNLQFTDSTIAIGQNTYLWKFGDGSTSGLRNPTHAYPKKDSIYAVSLKVVDSLGCADSLTKQNYIQVKVPVSAFDIKDSVAICPPLETKFFFKGTGYQSFYWDFGDSSTSSLTNPNHFYNTYGTYTAKLILTGFGGCVDSSVHTINLYNPNSSLIQFSPKTGCNDLVVDFAIKTPPRTYFDLFFGDGARDNSGKDSLKHFYNAPGSFTPTINLYDSLGCVVSIAATSPVLVLGANPFFSADRKALCDSGKIFFTNFTIGNDPVTSSVWDFGDGGTSTETDPVHNYTKPGLYLASLTIKTQTGCNKSIIDTIRVYATPNPSIAGNSTVCINAPLALNGLLARPDSTITWSWNLGNGQTALSKQTAATYTKDGTYTINLQATNVLGCKGAAVKTVTVLPLPVITMPSNIVIPSGTGINIPVTYSKGLATYNWTPVKGLSCADCAVPFALPRSNTTYAVKVTDSSGCSNTEDINIIVACDNTNYFVPNTFSPNGDGSNDVFYPRGNGLSSVLTMRIFNRWGEMIFERKNFPINSAADGWNGMLKGKPAVADAYVYVIEFSCANGVVIPYKGNITLIR